MLIKPLTLSQANEFITDNHRHHKKVVGHRFSIGLYLKNKLIGVCIVGRPVSREIPQYEVAEVTRLCTDGSKNACSKLYSAAARIAKEMGFSSIQTYILESESGVSLIASGWFMHRLTQGGSWDCKSRPRTDKAPIERKKLFMKVLNAGN